MKETKEEYKKMSAKEMFEKLGYEYNHYEKNKDDELYAIYVYEKRDRFQLLEKEIGFFPNLKQIEISSNDSVKRSELFDLEELQAINQQVKELGWLDEN